MVLTLNLILLIASGLCFLLKAFNVVIAKVDWIALGLLLFILSLIFN